MTQRRLPAYNTPSEISPAFLAVSDAARVPEDNPMVKVKGPLLSTDATGKLGNDLQLSHWKGRNVLGRRRRPSQPRTEAQQAHRILMGFLASQWKTFTPQQRVTWEYSAERGRLSPYNAYIRRNMERYRNTGTEFPKYKIEHASPTQAYPAAEAGVPPGVAHYSITGGTLEILIKWKFNAINDSWGLALHHTPEHAGPCNFQNLVAIFTANQLDWQEYLLTGLKPGLYRIATGFFTTDGWGPTYWNRKSAIVTPAGSPPTHAGPPQDEWPPPWPE